MGRARWLLLILIMAVLPGAVSGAAAQRPDGHNGASGTGSQTETGTESTTSGAAGCDLVEPYHDDFWSAMDNSGVYMDFLIADQEFGDLSRNDAEEIVAAGDELIAEVESLDVPAAYAPGHEGILAFLQINSDFARFYALDSSIVPDLNAYDASRLLILDGEIAVLDACPDEMEAIGGYIMFDPAGIEGDIEGE